MHVADFEKDVLQAVAKLDIPKEIAEKEWMRFQKEYRIDGFALTVDTDFGHKETRVFAVTRRGMFFGIMNELLDSIALRFEVIHREQEQSKWRYVQMKAVHGHRTYAENRHYIYNAVYDSRKPYFEYHIQWIATLFSLRKAGRRISYGLHCLNLWFPKNHWQFNKNTMLFEEINDSKEVDEQGIEHPQEEEIVR